MDVGADEAYSCDDQYLTEEDIYNPLDFNADGVVNFQEYAHFSAAWLSHDPNDPDVITDPNFAGDPDYADPNALAHWNQAYNLDAAANTATEYQIDLADFAIFCENWLWTACWKQQEFDLYGTILMSRGEELLSTETKTNQILSTSTDSAASLYTEAAPVHEAETLETIIEFLDEVLETRPDNKEAVLDLKAIIEGWLDEIDLE